MANYAIFAMNKLKTDHQMTESYKHDLRLERNIENVDESRSYLNRECISTNGVTYEELFRQKLAEMRMQGGCQKNFRKDATREFEVILQFSKEMEDKIDLDRWIEDSISWLNKTFNPPNQEAFVIDKKTGKESIVHTNNVCAVTLHLDETKPHLHAVIVPIDNTGELNASYYNHGRNKLYAYHDSYAKAMKKHGLVRPTKATRATAEEQTRYYGHLKKAVNATLPDIERGESAEEYKRRAEEVFQITCSQHRDEITRLKQQKKENQSMSYAERKELMQLRTEKKDILEEMSRAVGIEDTDFPEHIFSEVSRRLKEQKQFKLAAKQTPDKSKGERALQLYQEMVEWGRRENVLNERKVGRPRKEKEHEI